MALALTVAFAGAAWAQDDPIADAFCAVFTPEEMAGVLGTEVTAEPSFESCGWISTSTDSFAGASAGWAFGTLADQKAVWTGGSDLDVGGRQAYLSPEVGVLFVEVDGGVLMLMAFGLDVDVEAALTALGEMAVARAASIPAPAAPQVPPEQPSTHADPALEALFPASIGGAPVVVESLAGAEVITDDDDRADVEAALAAQGRSIDDLSGAFAFAETAGIVAFRIAGGDAAAFLPLLLETMAGDEEFESVPGQVAGKATTVVTSASSGTANVYPAGEVLWIVYAEEPALTEIFEGLP